MGLSLFVGMLADLKQNDPEACGGLLEEFASVNKALKAAGLPLHSEPDEFGDEPTWDCQMYGYSGLHYLRRLAAHIAQGLPLPPPGGKDAPKDPVLQRYYKRLGEGLQFAHLLHHSDAEGYYLPIDFPEVLCPAESLKIPGDMVGSSYRLLEECGFLAMQLELNLEMDPESDEVWSAADSQGSGDTKWKRYGIESFTCLRLYHGARVSIARHSALVFG